MTEDVGADDGPAGDGFGSDAVVTATARSAGPADGDAESEAEKAERRARRLMRRAKRARKEADEAARGAPATAYSASAATARPSAGEAFAARPASALRAVEMPATLPVGNAVAAPAAIGRAAIRIATIQNCQSGSTGAYLSAALPNATVDQFRLDMPTWNDPDEQERFIARNRDADLVLVQPNQQAGISPQRLQGEFGERVTVLCNLYYCGLTPDCVYVGSRARRVAGPLDYHSIIVLDAYKRGLAVAACEARFGGDGFDDLLLYDAHAHSLDTLRQRERQFGVAVSAVPLIERGWREERLFYTANHPTAALLARYMDEVLTHLGIAAAPVETARLRDPLIHANVLPIFDCVAEHHDLLFRTTQQYSTVQRRFAPLRQIIEGFYRSYDEASADDLVLHGDIHPAYRADPARFGHLFAD